MKRTFLLMLLLTGILTANAQAKKWEHNIYLSGGLLINKTNSGSDTGLSARIGYGLNRYFSEKFSVMAGVALRNVTESPFSSKDGSDDDKFTFLDIPIVAQYHMAGQGNGWVFGLGPVLSFTANNDTYNIDADPNSPHNHIDKLKNFGLGLQPSVFYQIGKFRIGAEAYVGLTNMEKKTTHTNGSHYIHDTVVTVQFHF